MKLVKQCGEKHNGPSGYAPVHSNRINVTFYHRKRWPDANYSLEAIFADVRARLDGCIESKVKVAPFRSRGVLRRVAIMLHAWWCSESIVHVTGDIHFACILLKRSKCVLTVADCGPLTHSHGLMKWLYRTFWFTLPIRKAGLVTVISEEVKRDLVSHLGYLPDHVSVIPVAISSLFIPAAKPFSQSCPRILQIGTAPNKNIARLCEAIRGMNCELVIVGKLDGFLIEILKECSIRYTNLVNLTDQEMVREYCNCDLVSFASTFEGFGMPILEAQATGRPVVTSNVSSMPEVAGNGACYVDPFDVGSIRNGVLRIVSDPGYRASLVAAGFENVRRFDGEHIAKQYLKLYEFLERPEEVAIAKSKAAVS